MSSDSDVDHARRIDNEKIQPFIYQTVVTIYQQQRIVVYSLQTEDARRQAITNPENTGGENW